MNSQLALQLEAKMKQGFQHHSSGELEQAQILYEEVLSKDPRHFNALQLLGTLCSTRQLFEKSADYLLRAIKLNNKNHIVYNNLANALKELGRYQESLENCNQSIKINKVNAEAFCIRGAVLQLLKRHDEAINSCNAAIEINPDFAEAYNNLGNALLDIQEYSQALVSFDRALKINPQYVGAYFNRAAVLQALHRIDDAILSLDIAITLQPDFADAFNNRGVVLLSIKQYDLALKDFDISIQLSPNRADAFVNRGNALRGLKRIKEALLSYQHALSLDPEFEYLFGTWLHLKMKLCDWSDFDLNIEKLKNGILAGKKIAIPFAVLSLIDDSSLHLKAAKIYHQEKFEEPKIKPNFIEYKKTRKIRIGYYSADFRAHATSFLIAGLFEAHDKNNFEVYGFSFGPNVADEMRERLILSFDDFFDVSSISDKEIIDLSRNIGIDIAIDLKGDTEDARVGIFTGRCAPLQVNYLGYPGSMGMDCYDYILADNIVIPEKNYGDYSEKVLLLPHSYQVNDSSRRISERNFTKIELGLPEAGFVFCCFNNSYKILPSTFALWMEILRNVEASVLWLYSDDIQSQSNLKKEAELRGVAGKRLIFAEMMSHAEHLARHKLADLFIDTLPYNAHTTASDALWAGLPVLTCMGESFASRVAASLLTAVNLDELVEENANAYVKTAIELAKNPKKMAYLKSKLENNVIQSDLFNTIQFAKNIESTYYVMLNVQKDDLRIEKY